jgi:ferredoxin/DMSO/TMAO reductase YedYZ heme-binding membrane subunit
MRTAQESVHVVAATVGFLSLVALWLGMLCGTTLRSGWVISRVRHSTIYGLHANLVLFGIWLGLVHAFTQLAVPNGKVRWLDEGAPFMNQFDPIGIGLGTLAMEMLVAFALSVLIQRRLGYHRWRTLHSLAYFAFTLLAAHVLVAGSDVASLTVRVVIVAAWAVAMLAGMVTFPAVARLPRRLVDRAFGQVRASDVTVSVDPTRCARFGFCEHEAPGIFSLRSDGRLAYRSSVSADQADKAMQAAMVCPARAITLGKLPTAVVVPPAESSAPAAGKPSVARSASRPAPPAGVPTGPPTGAMTGPMTGPPTGAMTGPVGGPPQPGPIPPGPPPQRPWSPLEDTGRHHIHPIRPIGRPTGGRR